MKSLEALYFPVLLPASLRHLSICTTFSYDPVTGLGLGSSEEGYRQDLSRIDEEKRKLMNGRRPDWKVRFAFYGGKNKEALAMASIGWKKRAELIVCRRERKPERFLRRTRAPLPL